jgi:hypothetical protein
MKRLCRTCEVHPAKFRLPNGKVKARKDHDLCQKCYRALVNKMRRGPRYWPMPIKKAIDT